ncbi:hypothetical protein B9Z55_007970 [Caenorhabditis nigoni]|uniref:Uncharacterized protein n=1 Tax=Caenorhabditis nigoni TaxID=1611254 RepID=A0A2G5VC16_9PELO|nr:hypothetical protein B9Z55_007970 [Caenorhabditis nigoni]
MRKPVDIDELDCEQTARLFRPEVLAPTLTVDTESRKVQPSLKARLSQSINPWKTSGTSIVKLDGNSQTLFLT